MTCIHARKETTKQKIMPNMCCILVKNLIDGGGALQQEELHYL